MNDDDDQDQETINFLPKADTLRERDEEKSSKPPGCRSRWSQASTLEKIWWVVVTPIRTVICFTNVTLFFITYFGFMVPVLPFKTLWPRFYYYYEGMLYLWLQAFIAYWGYTAGYDVYEYGEDIHQYAETDRVLVICNHQSTADVPTLFTVLQDKGVAARKTLWLMDMMFRWTPFGIVARMHGDHFIQQGKATRDKELIRLKEHLQKVFWDRDRRWVILFPEGGFLYKRKESSQKYARENGFPHLEYSTLPRMGAIKAILEEVGPRFNDDGSEEDPILRSRSSGKLQLIADTVGAIREKKYVKDTRPPIKYILDMTIAYPSGHPLSLATLIFGTREECDIAVHYKVYKAAEIPFQDDIRLRDWLYDAYEEKDKLLANYYKTGEFHRGEKGQRTVFTWKRIIGQYCFWGISFYLQYKLYKCLFRSLLYFILRL